MKPIHGLIGFLVFIALLVFAALAEDYMKMPCPPSSPTHYDKGEDR